MSPPRPAQRLARASLQSAWSAQGPTACARLVHWGGAHRPPPLFPCRASGPEGAALPPPSLAPPPHYRRTQPLLCRPPSSGHPSSSLPWLLPCSRRHSAPPCLAGPPGGGAAQPGRAGRYRRASRPLAPPADAVAGDSCFPRRGSHPAPPALREAQHWAPPLLAPLPAPGRPPRRPQPERTHRSPLCSGGPPHLAPLPSAVVSGGPSCVLPPGPARDPRHLPPPGLLPPLPPALPLCPSASGLVLRHPVCPPPALRAVVACSG